MRTKGKPINFLNALMSYDTEENHLLLLMKITACPNRTCFIFEPQKI